MSSFVKSSLLVSVLTLVSSIISFGNQVIIAANFGTGHEMDTYLLLTSFPFLVSGVIGSAFSFSLIPHFVTKSFDYFIQFVKISAGVTFILFLFFFLLYNFVVIDYYNLKDFQHIKILNLVIWLVFYFTIIFNIISCYFTSKSKFIVPVILNFLPFIFSILATILFNELGVLSVIAGLLLGYLCAIAYSYIQFKKEIIELNQGNFKKEIIQFLKSMKYSAFSMLTFSVFQIVDAYWGGKLGESVISYLGYSQRIIIAIGALVISGPSSVLIPKLTQAYKRGDLDVYYKYTSTVIKLVFALTSFAALLGSFFATAIVRIMFQRGNFTENSTQNIASILPFMLIGMIFMLCVVISFRAIFVQPITYKTGFLGVLTLAIYFILSGVLSRFWYIKGIALSYVLTWIVIFSVTMILLYKRNISAFANSFFKFLLKQIFALAVVFAAGLFLCIFSKPLLGKFDVIIIGELVQMSIVSFLLLVIYIFVSTKLMKMEEMVFLLNKIRSR